MNQVENGDFSKKHMTLAQKQVRKRPKSSPADKVCHILLTSDFYQNPNTKSPPADDK
jgi:hypothetical protein